MIDVNFLRNEPDRAKELLLRKKVDPKTIDKFIRIDTDWRQKTAILDGLKAEQNALTKEISAAENKDELLTKAQILKKRIVEISEDRETLEKKRDEVLYKLPNFPFEDVTQGKDESENKTLREVGKRTVFDFIPKDYLSIAESLGIIDVKKAGEISGSRFGYLMGDAALLEFALVQFTFETLTNEKVMKEIAHTVSPGHSANTFIPVVPPQMIKPSVFERMGRLEPREERYHIPSDDVYLIGSAEHTLGPLHMDETIPEEQLPIRYIGFSTSFRREAGSYGKDTKGILRVHQFDKLEMESFSAPEYSRTEQDFIVSVQEYLVQSLGIPYRVVEICTGDMGGPDARQIDIEMWMPGQSSNEGSELGTYRETHTSDLMTDYQSRRLKTKIKRKDGKSEYAHMNDATAFAIGRTLIAIIENFQTKEGAVKIPKVLQKYLGKTEIKPR